MTNQTASNQRIKRQNMLLDMVAATGRYEAKKLVADFSVRTGLTRSKVAEYIEDLQVAGFLRIVGSFVELIEQAEKKEDVQT